MRHSEKAHYAGKGTARSVQLCRLIRTNLLMAGNGLLIGLLTIGKERLSYDFRNSRKTSLRCSDWARCGSFRLQNSARCGCRPACSQPMRVKRRLTVGRSLVRAKKPVRILDSAATRV